MLTVFMKDVKDEQENDTRIKSTDKRKEGGLLAGVEGSPCGFCPYLH